MQMPSRNTQSEVASVRGWRNVTGLRFASGKIQVRV